MKQLMIILCFSSTMCFGQSKKIYFYGVTLSAQDVLGCKGKNCVFNTPADIEVRDLKRIIPMGSRYEFLGRNYSTTSYYKASKFLNANTDRNTISVLDSINFKFYDKEGLGKLDSIYAKDTIEYRSFREQFIKYSKDYPALKAFLQQQYLSKYTLALFNSRYITTLDKNISVLKKIHRVINIGLTAEIKDSIKAVGGIDFSTDNSIKDTLDKKIQSSILKFYTIQLDDEYIKIAGRFFNKYWEDKGLNKSMKNSSDDFLQDLNDYLEDGTQGVIAYGNVLEATLSTTDTSNLSRSIGAAISAKLNQTDKENLLPKIQGKISAIINKNINQSRIVESKHSYYLLNYGVDKRLEKGNNIPTKY